MKRTLALLLALVMLLGMLPMSAFADTPADTPTITFTHNADPSTLKVGDEFTVTATLANNPGIGAFQLDLNWDNNVVEFLGYNTVKLYGMTLLESDVMGGATLNQKEGTIVIGTEENLSENGKLFVAKFKVKKEGDPAITHDADYFQLKKIIMNDDGTSSGSFEAYTVTFDMTALENLIISHVHDYTSEVTPPTCTKDGYTTYTCTCSHSYTGDITPATGHTNVSGTCSVCGAALTVIPDGAPFLDMMTSDGKPVTITEMGMDPQMGMGTLYKVEVPVGTTQVDITYNSSDVSVDNFGYATTYVFTPSNSGRPINDGYNQTTKDGKTTVGLQMVKQSANGTDGTIYLLNTPYPADPYELVYAGLGKEDFSNLHFFAFTYKMEEGQYGVSLPKSFMYTVTGDPVATGSYTFKVAMKDGYEASETFAVKVNDEVVSTEPGEITVDSVTKELIITVEGVKKIYNPETDISITVDLTEYTGEVDGFLSYNDKAGNTYESNLIPGKRNTVVMEASQVWQLHAYINSIGSDVVGYDINGETRDPGNLSFGFVVRDNAQPGAYVIKPIMKNPTFNVNIDENITGGTVTATPNPAEANATVTLTQVPDAGYEFVEFTVTDAEGNAVEVTESIVGEDITYTFTMPAGNVTVSAEYRELPNTITEYDVSHPLMEKKSVEIDGETHDNINVLSLFQGYAEKLIEVIETLVEDKISAQHLKFTSSNPDVAKIEDGKVIPGIPGTALITVEPADNEAAAATFNLLRNNNAQQFAVVVSEVPAGYTVVMPEDTDPGLGDTFLVNVTVGSDTANAPVNAYDMTFTYDPAKLELLSQADDPEAENYLEGLHVGDEIPAGTIHMERYGENQTAGSVVFTLKFKVLAAGNTSIQVTSAKVGTSEEALEKDASVAALADPVTQINANYKVTPPTGFTGASSVAPNTNYTFSGSAYYDYTFSVTVGGETVEDEDAVTDKGNGTFVIDKRFIKGNVVITVVGEPTGKLFNVTLGQDMDHTFGMVEEDGVTKVQYMKDYTATLTPAEGYHYYNLTVTIGGAAYSGYETVKNDNGTTSYKIRGEDITGDIVFTHDKSQLAANEVPVNFTGNGAPDRAAGTAEKATIDEAYSFTLDKKAGFNYTVTYKMGDVTEFTAMDQNDNVYSIGKVTGAITINIEKVSDLEVQVTNYINLNGKTMFLVTATQTLEEGKVLAYDNTPMFQKTYTYVTETPEGTTTEEKTEWVYLVMVDKAAEGAEPVVFDAAAAKAKITDITATTTVLGKTFNVNESGITDGDSIGTVDINDAQLVFDMYNNVYQNFETASMQKFLKADVNGDKTVGVMDAAAIVSHIIAAKNA